MQSLCALCSHCPVCALSRCPWCPLSGLSVLCLSGLTVRAWCGVSGACVRCLCEMVRALRTPSGSSHGIDARASGPTLSGNGEALSRVNGVFIIIWSQSIRPGLCRGLAGCPARAWPKRHRQGTETDSARSRPLSHMPAKAPSNPIAPITGPALGHPSHPARKRALGPVQAHPVALLGPRPCITRPARASIQQPRPHGGGRRGWDWDPRLGIATHF